jgi:plastocyanin
MTRRRVLQLIGAAVVVIAGIHVVGPLFGWKAIMGPDGWANGTSTTNYERVAELDDFFQPQIVRVQPGTEVVFRNSGRNPHNVTADDGSFQSGLMTGGQEFSHTFTTPGIYRFTCTLHGQPGGIGMTGIVAVGDVALPETGGTAVGPGREPVPAGPGATIRVPQDRPTIQAGVDAARPGDLILVSPGVYEEAVLVTTPYLTIRGLDRNATILDGGLTKANGIHVVEADGVSIENMTARHYQLNGFYWTSVQGYRGSYLTAYGNGDYGIYAFDSVFGRFDHDYASGHPDSGFYIGQCQPCDAVITDSIAVHNALGYSGTNAGGDLLIVNSEWTDNNAGIAPNTLDSELLAPQTGVEIAGNWIHENNAVDAPLKRLEYPPYGIGVVVAGGRDNVVEGNVVEGNATFGIALLPNLDSNFWATRGNTVRGNLVTGSGRADLALGAPSVNGDCFAGNDFATSLPPAIETFAGCGARIGGGGDVAATLNLLGRFAAALGGHYTSGDWQSEPRPPGQPQLPDAASAPASLAIPEVAVPGPVTVRTLAEVQAIATAAPAAHTTSREVLLMGIPLGSALTTILGLYGYVFPMVLYAAWVAIALWDLVRRDALTPRRRYLWMTAVLLVPLAGPIVYFASGGSEIPRGTRWFLVAGGLTVYLVVAVLALLAEAL